jgi:hypothetical protein
MSKTAFSWSLVIIALVMLSLLSVIGKPGFQAQQAQRTVQPLSPEQITDLTRRIIEPCYRLPVGHPDRPDICEARR